jgi:hypothetical protein
MSYFPLLLTWCKGGEQMIDFIGDFLPVRSQWTIGRRVGRSHLLEWNEWQ